MNLEEKDIFVAVQWPESQELLELPDFNDNAILINDEGLYEEYGPSSYVVRKIWLDSIHSKKKDEQPFAKI